MEFFQNKRIQDWGELLFASVLLSNLKRLLDNSEISQQIESLQRKGESYIIITNKPMINQFLQMYEWDIREMIIKTSENLLWKSPKNVYIIYK